MTCQLRSLLYLSDGKHPSTLASALQVVKMSQAFAPQIEQFELVTSGSLRSLVSPRLQRQFWQWYGITQPFSVTRLPVLLRTPPPFAAESYAPRGYIRLALAYCQWRNPQVVYTRTPFLVPQLLKHNLNVMLEHHEPLNPRRFDLGLLQHPRFLGLVTLADELAKGYQAQGLAAGKICIAPSAAEIEAFLPAQSTTKARQKLTLPSDRPIIAYVGQLYDHKGIPTLLELAPQLPDCLFLLVGGTAADVARIQQYCQTHKLANVQLTGHITQQALPPYLYAADILLLPTSQRWALASTTSPLKLFDYMAVQRPIVAANLPNIATVLQDGVNGRLVESDNAAAFGTAIASLLANPAEGQRLAKQAYQDVRSRTWGDRATKILTFIEQQYAQKRA